MPKINKKKNGYKPGPLFTKISGIAIPKKVEYLEMEPIGKKDKIKWSDGDASPVINVTAPKPIESIADLVPLFKKIKPPVLKNGRWTDDDEDENDSDASNDSFDKYFTDVNIKPKRKVIERETDEESDDEILPGFTKAKKFRAKYNYTKKRVGGPKTFFCSVCQQYFNQTAGHPENMINHILTIHASLLEDEKYKCRICDNIFQDKKHIRKHFDTHRELEKPRQCPTCGKTFTEYKTWRAHSHRDRSVASLPLEKRTFPCEVCGRVCSTEKYLKDHIKTVHEKQGRKCRWCAKIISYDEWEEHKENEKIKHNFYTPSTCEICGITLATKNSAANHRRNFHRDLPEVECDICHKKFKTNGNLIVHKQTTHGEKRFQCGFCSYRKSYKFLVTLHIKRKHHLKAEDIPADAIIEHEKGSFAD